MDPCPQIYFEKKKERKRKKGQNYETIVYNTFHLSIYIHVYFIFIFLIRTKSIWTQGFKIYEHDIKENSNFWKSWKANMTIICKANKNTLRTSLDFKPYLRTNIDLLIKKTY